MKKPDETSEWFEIAREIAQAERELGIERWVSVSIERVGRDGVREQLYQYDLPRELKKRREWVIDWRCNRFRCQYPRDRITAYSSYYDRRTGLHTGMDHILGRVAAAKAQITRVERAIARYIEHERWDNMFFDAATDERLRMFSAKLERKRENYAVMCRMLDAAVEERRQRPDAYKLFHGFERLGLFDTPEQARDFATRCGHAGSFTLLGPKGYKRGWTR